MGCERLISHRYAARAISLLSIALAIEPDDPGLLNLLGVTPYSAGHIAHARRASSEAQALLPDNASIRNNLALVQRER